MEVAEREGIGQRDRSVASERDRADQGLISPVKQANVPEGGSSDDAQAPDGACVTSKSNLGNEDEALGCEVEVLESEGGRRRSESAASERERAETGSTTPAGQANTANGGCDQEIQTTDGASVTSQSNQGGEDEAFRFEAGGGEVRGCRQPNVLKDICFISGEGKILDPSRQKKRNTPLIPTRNPRPSTKHW